MERAGQHGLHRWQRGYSLRELLHELNNLYLTLTEEFDQYLQLYPDTPVQVASLIHRELLRLSTEINSGSVIYYDDLTKNSAAEQLQTLQLAFDQLHQLTNQRSRHLRETTHDLRGSFGIVSSAVNLLAMPLEADERQVFLDMLSRNVVTTLHLLEQLGDHARLEAGQDSLTISAFNAAELLQQLVN